MRASRIEGVGGGMGLGSSRAASAKKGSSKPAVKKAIKNAKKAKPLAEPKSAVKVKPPSKTKPAPQDSKKINRKTYNSSMERYERRNSPDKQYDDMGPEFTANRRNMRIINSSNPSASGKASRPATSPTNPEFRPRVKINSASKKKK